MILVNGLVEVGQVELAVAQPVWMVCLLRLILGHEILGLGPQTVSFEHLNCSRLPHGVLQQGLSPLSHVLQIPLLLLVYLEHVDLVLDGIQQAVQGDQRLQYEDLWQLCLRLLPEKRVLGQVEWIEMVNELLGARLVALLSLSLISNLRLKLVVEELKHLEEVEQVRHRCLCCLLPLGL